MNHFRLILGNQLFPEQCLSRLGEGPLFMAEDHGLCTHYQYHKQKLVLFLASMRKYRDQLRSGKHEVFYIEASHHLFEASYEEKLDAFLTAHPKVCSVAFFEIEDKFFEDRMFRYFRGKNIEVRVESSPMFMCSREGFVAYLESVNRPFMKTFYERQRKQLRVLLENGEPVGGQWSFDKDNRKKLPKNLAVPGFEGFAPDETVIEVMDFVEMNFDGHPGTLDQFVWPTSRTECLQLLDLFIAEKLKDFGAYQDAITSQSEFVFHSLLAPAINMGLILPDEIVRSVERAWRNSDGDIPINSVEGFVRQIIGWREFVRGIYQTYSEKQWSSNFWNNNNQPRSCWYEGATGIPVLDDAIHKTQRFAYSHHIERLMVLSNMMLLTEWHPHAVYKWFMEMHCDSSDWVMGPNVFGMGQFSDGGVFATKPYICGSNYYLKMSDYPKGEWCDVVDGLYWRFIDKHKQFYRGNPRLSMMTKTLEKMDASRKQRIFRVAEEFISKTMQRN